jgi:hypothetical protein
VTAGAPKCECGVYAIAECTDCGSPLCGDCLRRAEGRVYCKAHVREGRAAQQEARYEQKANRFIAELGGYQAKISDPVERLLCVAASLEQDPQYWIRWRSRLLTVIEDTLSRPHPFFRIDPETPRIEITSPETFASWVFGHPRARKEIIKVAEWSRFTRHSHTVASPEAVRITPDLDDTTFDDQHRHIKPGLMLLSSGVFCRGIYTKGEWKRLSAQSPDPIAGTRIVQVALALGIPIACYDDESRPTRYFKKP